MKKNVLHKNKKSVIIGVCGRSGSGKSTVVKELVSLGCECVDADKCARNTMKNGSKCLEEIRCYFGDSIFLPDGELNRKALAEEIFNSDEKRIALI